MKRVTGICSTTISTPLTAMTIPKSAGVNPASPIAIGSPTAPCWKMSATRKHSPTTLMKRPSRSTVPSPTEASSCASFVVATGRDSGSLRKTTTAQTSVIPASHEEPGDVAELGDEAGAGGGDGEPEVDGPVVEGERADAVLGPHDVRHHRLHGRPRGVARHAHQEGDAGDGDRVVHEAEQRDGERGGRLGDEQRGPPSEPVGHDPAADRRDDPAEPVQRDDETGVRGGVAAVEGQVERHERGDEGPEPVDEGAGPQPPELAGQPGDGFAGGAFQSGDVTQVSPTDVSTDA